MFGLEMSLCSCTATVLHPWNIKAVKSVAKRGKGGFFVGEHSRNIENVVPRAILF